jgi:hypothetical protein
LPLTGALLVFAAPPARGQLFLASRPDPPFAIGPLIVRATVTEGATAVTINVLWSLAIPSAVRPADVAQDLYLLWPGEIQGVADGGQADAALTRYIEERGFSVIGEGRVALQGQPLSDGRGATDRSTATFAVFVQTSGALGLSPPATLVRIPWTPRLAEPGWLMDLRMTATNLIKPRRGTWIEELVVGGRYLFSMSFNEVRDRPLFPMYFAHRDRVVRLADAPAELVASFAHSDRLKVDQVFPPTAIRRLSETEETTEIVSLFLDKTEGIAPQNLSVQFGYFSKVQTWALLLLPALVFALGQAVGPMLGRRAVRVVNAATARVHVAGWAWPTRTRERGVIIPRAVLGDIVPGRTTRAEVIRLCGSPVEQHEQFPASNHTTLIYRGRRLVPRTRRRLGWLATVDHWEAEHHEVRIELEGDVVRDIHEQVRHYRVLPDQPIDGAPETP